MTVLLVAAMPREFHGLLRRCSGVGKLGWPVDWARSAECRGTRLVLVANGVGIGRASEAAAVAGRAGIPDAVVSFGFCGALNPALAVGDVFAASAVVYEGNRFLTASPRSEMGYASGILITSDRVARTAREKAELRAGGGDAVDMEAAGVARASKSWGVPFYCVRAVTDLPDESLTLDFNSALRSDGHFDTMLLLRQAMETSALPELWRLRKRCRVAARKLGEFIAGCRF